MRFLDSFTSLIEGATAAIQQRQRQRSATGGIDPDPYRGATEQDAHHWRNHYATLNEARDAAQLAVQSAYRDGSPDLPTWYASFLADDAGSVDTRPTWERWIDAAEQDENHWRNHFASLDEAKEHVAWLNDYYRNGDYAGFGTPTAPAWYQSFLQDEAEEGGWSL